MNGYTFRLVLLAGRFADHTILPAATSLHPQDFLNMTVVAGVTPMQAVQNLLQRYGVTLPESAVQPVPTELTEGLVLLAALTAEELERIPPLHDFEVQRTDSALARAWMTGRFVPDFFTVMSQARGVYESLSRQRTRQGTSTAVTA